MPNPIVLVISGPVARADVQRLCERVSVLLQRSDGDLVICDSDALDEPDAVTVDFLARLQLTARRLGRRVQLLDACGELQDLLELTGLSEVVPPYEELLLEPGGQAEQGEPPRGVEEEGDPADPIA
jgi:ABC-type transporter Mla MlaB component